MKNDFQNVPTPARGSAPDSEADRAAARKSYERDIETLDRLVKQFKIDYRRFFAGDLPTPPETLRERIAAGLRRLQSSKLATSVDRFRLSSLEAHFNSNTERFGRQLRESEQGGTPRREVERPLDPEAGVVVGGRATDAAVNALYKGLYLRDGQRNPKMDLERFRGYLSQQAEAIRAKTGCAEIQFRIAQEGGKMKIKAKPIKKA